MVKLLTDGHNRFLVVLVKYRQFNEAAVKDRLFEIGVLDFRGILG